MRKDSFGLAKQTVYGTKVTVMEQFPPVEAVDVKDVSENIQADETTGTRFPQRMEKGVKGYEITAKGNLRPSSAPKILAGFLGAPTKTNPYLAQAAAYSYLFDPVSADPVLHSLLATMKDPVPTAIVGLFFDAIGSTLTLRADPSDFLSFEAGYFAADVDLTQAVPTPTLDTTKRFTFDQVHVFASINGAGEVEIPSAAWQIAYSNAEDRNGKILGQRKLYDLYAGDAACEVQFTPKTGLDVHFARALMDDPDSVKLRMTATGATIAGAVNFLVEVIVYLAEYIEAPAGIQASSRLNAVPVKARAAYDTASGKFVTVQVVNAINNAA